MIAYKIFMAPLQSTDSYLVDQDALDQTCSCFIGVVDFVWAYKTSAYILVLSFWSQYAVIVVWVNRGVVEVVGSFWTVYLRVRAGQLV